MNSKLNMKENITNFKTWSCYMKNKFKIKHLKHLWLISNIIKFFKLKLMMLKKWWLKKDNFKLKLIIKINKFKLLIWELKKWTVIMQDKFQNYKKKLLPLKLIIKNGLKDKIKRPNYGMKKELNLKKKFIN
jgi:hypothetical protein